MAHRARSGWLAVAALAAAVAGLAPSSAGASSPWRPQLVVQSPVATLDDDGRAAISLAVSVGPGSVSSASVSLYPKELSRAALGPVLDGRGLTGSPLAGTGRFDLDCRVDGVARFSVAVTSAATRPSVGCGSTHLELDLRCATATCAGVYPLAVTVGRGSSTRTIWSLLSVTTSKATSPLAVALVATADPAGSRSLERAAVGLRVLAGDPAVDCAIAIGYRGLSSAVITNSPGARDFRSALHAAVDETTHLPVALTPPSVDFGGLRAHHLRASVARQVDLGPELVQQLTGRAAGDPLVLQGVVTARDVGALARSGVDQLVVPNGDLTPDPNTTLDEATPFHIAGAPSAVVALGSDGPLGTIADERGSAARRAALTLGVLAMVHFQAPDAAVTRSDVVEIGLERSGSAYLTDLLEGLEADPLLTPESLPAALLASRVGADGHPTTWALVPRHPPAITDNEAAQIATTYDGLISLRRSTVGPAPTLPALVRLLLAETDATPAARAARLDAASSDLAHLAGEFRVDSTPITLAGAGAELPVTLTSSADFPIAALVVVSGDGVRFPNGHIVPTFIDTPTDSLRLPATVTGSGNFTLHVSLETTDRAYVIAAAAIQVKSKSTSIVGYLLTIAALGVIAMWWWRTARRRHPARHAS